MQTEHDQHKPLNDFYLSLKQGCIIEDFLFNINNKFHIFVPNSFKREYTTEQNIFKKLRDEIMPAASFLTCHGAEYSKIKMPLNDEFPDCELINASGQTEIVEITTAGARARYHLNKELFQEETGRGFIDLHDNSPEQDFRKTMDSEREAYSTEQALQNLLTSISIALKKKSKPDKVADILLIYYLNFNALPPQRWHAIKRELINLASISNHKTIYLLGNKQDNFIMRIK